MLLTKRMGKVYLSGKVEMLIKVATSMMKGMGMERCVGLMVVFIKDFGFMGFKMELV